MSDSQRATWESDQPRIDSRWDNPGGGSSILQGVGVLGKGELWPRTELTRDGITCWEWKDEVGEAGEFNFEFGSSGMRSAVAADIVYDAK